MTTDLFSQEFQESFEEWLSLHITKRYFKYLSTLLVDTEKCMLDQEAILDDKGGGLYATLAGERKMLIKLLCITINDLKDGVNTDD